MTTLASPAEQTPVSIEPHDYVLLSSSDAADLSEKVTVYLRHGYKLHGPPFMQGLAVVCQLLIGVVAVNQANGEAQQLYKPVRPTIEVAKILPGRFAVSNKPGCP